MILRPRPAAIDLLFALRGSILPVVAPKLVLVALVSGLALWLHQLWPGRVGIENATPFTLLGLGLPIFLGFRNNACYDRWWEGRKQWGALVATARNMLRDINALLPETDKLRPLAAHLVGAFARRLRDQLRGLDEDTRRDWQPADGWARGTSDKSGRLLAELAAELAQRMRDGRISDITYRLFADHLAAMTDVQAACERLRGAPMPFAYSLMLHRTVWLFCLLLPFGMVDTLGYGTPALSLILAYAFLGLDALGEQLEAPFSTAPNGLPLDAMVRTIEIAVAETLGEPAPEPLRPTNFVLL